MSPGTAGGLEAVVLTALLAGDAPDLAVLRAQAEAASWSATERTDVGFFVRFEVPPHVPRLAGRPDLVLDDLGGELRGCDRIARFLLCVRDGALDFLEGGVLGDRWPESPVLIRAYYLVPSPLAPNLVVESSRRQRQRG